MQGLPPAILGDQRELARLPEASVSNSIQAFSLFVNAGKGLSILQVSRNLGVQVKTAFVLLHKLLSVDHHGPDDVWSADRLPRLAKCVEHVAGLLPLLEPALG